MISFATKLNKFQKYQVEEKLQPNEYVRFGFIECEFKAQLIVNVKSRGYLGQGKAEFTEKVRTRNSVEG